MSDPVAAPPLPHVWRPRRARIVGFAMAAIVAVGGLAFAIALPHSPSAPYGVADRIGIAVVAVGIAAGLLVLVRPRLEADDTGLTVTNFLHRRRIAWTEVVGIDMAPTESWIELDLDDGTSLPVVGVQTADGARFRESVAELQALLDAHGAPPA